MKNHLKLLTFLIVSVCSVSCSEYDPLDIEDTTSEVNEISMTLSHADALLSFKSDTGKPFPEAIELVGVKVFGAELENVGMNRFRGVLQIRPDQIDQDMQEFLDNNRFIQTGNGSITSKSEIAGDDGCSRTFLGSTLDWWSSVSDLPTPELSGCYDFYQQTCITVTEIIDPEFGSIMSTEFFVWFYAEGTSCQ